MPKAPSKAPTRSRSSRLLPLRLTPWIVLARSPEATVDINDLFDSIKTLLWQRRRAYSPRVNLSIQHGVREMACYGLFNITYDEQGMFSAIALTDYSDRVNEALTPLGYKDLANVEYMSSFIGTLKNSLKPFPILTKTNVLDLYLQGPVYNNEMKNFNDEEVNPKSIVSDGGVDEEDELEPPSEPGPSTLASAVSFHSALDVAEPPEPIQCTSCRELKKAVQALEDENRALRDQQQGLLHIVRGFSKLITKRVQDIFSGSETPSTGPCQDCCELRERLGRSKKVHDSVLRHLTSVELNLTAVNELLEE
ncbi:hypothetical protein D9758_007811 [Tetrapyrgos nigripes]|uniref:Uncharacterized protein n=1 Tax=Tetrapyrgos nigripes TaxID=182062 RepID=A0A8H5D008_9AGAR|nr:hypothetical protein D9758_007811 [Tetrapyrgos nigripes]